ncbi:DMT family transporter [Clostridium aminobutyricum]|uniref:DMT family transporter n=1 Tax=Clostridium aminobutyricum TaxID=33953 RepID=A0A939IHT2_CLOAM|nr:DMT family transporter [Clostridium aminobutyricum]MBN7771868.1 DMT family transporter [Clostridium aminobutyricum]
MNTESNLFEQHSKKDYTIYFGMVICAVFWSGAFIAGKFCIPYIPVFSLTFLRFFFASLILYFVVRHRNNKALTDSFKLSKQHLPIFLFTGSIGMFGYHVLFFTSLKYTTAINSSIIGAMNPIVTVLIAAIALSQKIPLKHLFGILISFSGVVLTISGGHMEVLKNFDFNNGDILMLLAVICWAAYSVFSKVKGSLIPPLQLTYYSFIVCDIMLFPFVLYERPWIFLPEIPFSAWLGVLYMAIFPSVIGYLFQQIAIKQIGPSRSSIFVNLVPAFSIILAVLILHEPLQPVKLLTALIIILGVCICQSTAASRPVLEVDL